MKLYKIVFQKLLPSLWHILTCNHRETRQSCLCSEIVHQCQKKNTKKSWCAYCIFVIKTQQSQIFDSYFVCCDCLSNSFSGLLASNSKLFLWQTEAFWVSLTSRESLLNQRNWKENVVFCALISLCSLPLTKILEILMLSQTLLPQRAAAAVGTLKL